MSPVVGIQQFPVGFSIWIYLRFFVFPGFLWGPCGFSDWVSYGISYGGFQCGDPYGGGCPMDPSMRAIMGRPVGIPYGGVYWVLGFPNGGFLLKGFICGFLSGFRWIFLWVVIWGFLWGPYRDPYVVSYQVSYTGFVWGSMYWVSCGVSH